MAQKQTPAKNWLQYNVIRLVRVHLVLAAVYALIVLAADAWNLVTPELTWKRWLLCGVLVIVAALTGYLARAKTKNAVYYRVLVWVLVLVDIALATFVVYTERGMASRGVMLYTLAIACAGALRSRSGLVAATLISVAAYVLAATRYFFVYFNEGLKAELYTTLGLYGAGFCILAALLHIAIGPKQSD